MSKSAALSASQRAILETGGVTTGGQGLVNARRSCITHGLITEEGALTPAGQRALEIGEYEPQVVVGVSAKVPMDIWRQIDALAYARGWSTAQAVKHLIELGLSQEKNHD